MAKAPARKTSKTKAATRRGRQSTQAKTTAKRPAQRYVATPAERSDRQHLAAVIRERTGCSAEVARTTLNSLIGTLTTSLKKNKKVQLTGFGSFTVVRLPARKARNPRTGESIRAKASRTVRFKAGRTLKRSV